MSNPNNTLVSRLRKYKVSAPPEFPVHPILCDEAANRIEHLEKLLLRFLLAVDGAHRSCSCSNCTAIADEVAEMLRIGNWTEVSDE